MCYCKKYDYNSIKSLIIKYSKLHYILNVKSMVKIITMKIGLNKERFIYYSKNIHMHLLLLNIAKV